jgi:hypothetical protein
MDWNGIRGAQQKLLWNALVSDFDEAELNAALITDVSRGPLSNYASSKPTYRLQAFELIEAAKRQGWVRELIDGLVAANPRGPGLRHFRETVGLTAELETKSPGGWTPESLLRADPDFLIPDKWLAKLAALRRRVCRIEHPSRPVEKPGFGTGWLVGPDLLLTAHHVIRPFQEDGTELVVSEVTCRFDMPEPPPEGGGRTYELAQDWLVDTGAAKPGESALDYAIIRLAQPAAKDEVDKNEVRGVMLVANSTAAPKPGDNLLIVQHPDGLPQRFAFGNAVQSGQADVLLHDANTCKGSSGSPVVNIKLEPVAMHRAGAAANYAVALGAIAARAASHGVALG